MTTMTVPQDDCVPSDLSNRNHWVCWRAVERDGKTTKLPVNSRTGGLASSTNPGTWTDYNTALTAAKQHGWGVGFVFAGDGLVGIDLDACLDPATGDIAAWAADILNDLDSYTEISPSGTGLHILLGGSIPRGVRREIEGGGTLEIYDRGRYFTFTGNALDGPSLSVQNRQEELDELWARHFPEPNNPGRSGGGASGDTPVGFGASGQSPPLTDDQVRERAFRSKHGETIRRLYEGDDLNLPSTSEADAKLIYYL